MHRRLNILLSIVLISVVFTFLGLMKSDWFRGETVELQPTTTSESEVVGETRGYSDTPTLWNTVTQVPDDAPSIRDDLPTKFLVKIDQKLLRDLVDAEQFSITLPPFEDTSIVLIYSVETLQSGNVAVLGKVDGNRLFDFVATIGANSLNATIGTERGVYNLRGDHKYAWVSPGSSFNHLVASEVPDFLVRSPN